MTWLTRIRLGLVVWFFGGIGGWIWGVVSSWIVTSPNPGANAAKFRAFVLATAPVDLAFFLLTIVAVFLLTSNEAARSFGGISKNARRMARVLVIVGCVDYPLVLTPAGVVVVFLLPLTGLCRVVSVIITLGCLAQVAYRAGRDRLGRVTWILAYAMLAVGVFTAVPKTLRALWNWQLWFGESTPATSLIEWASMLSFAARWPGFALFICQLVLLAAYWRLANRVVTQRQLSE